jgi:uncharacterized protein YggT (Ycf19 family)
MIDLSPVIVILLMVLLKVVLIGPLFGLYEHLAFHPVRVF